MSEPRTFVVQSPHMRGKDIETWQIDMRGEFERMQIDFPILVDGDYGIASRDACASLCTALGIIHGKAMAKGVTPFLRAKIRHRDLTDAEKNRMNGQKAKDYRRGLRDKHKEGGVCSPLAKILTHANGFTSGHDGVDLICPRDSPGFAICKARVVRADNGGWWGKGAPSPAVAAKGDGITIIRSLVDIGPIRKGMNFGYGHAEANRVKVGDIVEAGQRINKAGMANAPHFHFMVNMRGDDRGVGDRDPWPIVKYCIEHA